MRNMRFFLVLFVLDECSMFLSFIETTTFEITSIGLASALWLQHNINYTTQLPQLGLHVSKWSPHTHAALSNNPLMCPRTYDTCKHIRIRIIARQAYTCCAQLEPLISLIICKHLLEACIQTHRRTHKTARKLQSSFTNTLKMKCGFFYKSTKIVWNSDFWFVWFRRIQKGQLSTIRKYATRGNWDNWLTGDLVFKCVFAFDEPN